MRRRRDRCRSRCRRSPAPVVASPCCRTRRPRGTAPAPAAGGDLVEVVLHAGGERVVDLGREVALEELDHGERRPRRHERLALLPHVAAVLDRLHDRRVGRRPADAQLLQPLDQRRLGVAGRRLGGVAHGVDGGVGQPLADRQVGEQALAVVEVGLGVVGALDVDPQVAGERDGAARGRPVRGRRAGDRRSAAGAEREGASMRTDTVLPTASAICEASVRFQIRS